MSNVTHQNIAEMAGVSRVLVTQALHGTRSSRVSSETRNHILQVAKELGYQPRNLTTYTIGYVLESSNWSNEANTWFMRCLSAALRERGYRLVLIGTEISDSSSLADRVSPKSMDGLILDRWDRELAESLPAEMPYLVSAEQDDIPDDVEVVSIDFQETFFRIMTHLRERGHQRFCVVTARSTSGFYTRLMKSAEKAFARLNDTGLHLQFLQSRECSGELDVSLRELLTAPGAPTALIATDLWRATPILYALRDSDFRIPQDVSVVSVFDSRMFINLAPNTTATTAGGDALARLTVERLLEKVENPLSTPAHTYLPGELIPRDSVGPPRSGG